MHGIEVCQYGIIHSRCRCVDHYITILIECDKNERHQFMVPQIDMSRIESKQKRVRLEVYVDLDPMSTRFDSIESVCNTVGILLSRQLPHNNPIVSVGKNDEVIDDRGHELKLACVDLQKKLDQLESASESLLLVIELIKTL